MYVCMYVGMYVCMYVCMFVYMHVSEHTVQCSFRSLNLEQASLAQDLESGQRPIRLKTEPQTAGTLEAEALYCRGLSFCGPLY